MKNENALFDYLFVRDILRIMIFFYLKHYRKYNFHLTCAVKWKKATFFMFLRHWFWWEIERNKIIILHKFFLIPPFAIDWFLGQHGIKWMRWDLFCYQMKLERYPKRFQISIISVFLLLFVFLHFHVFWTIQCCEKNINVSLLTNGTVNVNKTNSHLRNLLSIPKRFRERKSLHLKWICFCRDFCVYFKEEQRIFNIIVKKVWKTKLEK